MKLKFCIYIAFVWLFFMQSICVAGTIHKCTDSNGNVYFTDAHCPAADTVTKETIQIQSAPPPRNPRSDYISLQDQMWTLDKNDARRAREKAQQQYKWEASRRSSEQRENRREAEKLTKKAQRIYKNAIDAPRGKRAMREQAKSLERQADVLMGRRETIAPTATERKLEELEEKVNRRSVVVPSDGDSGPHFCNSNGFCY